METRRQMKYQTQSLAAKTTLRGPGNKNIMHMLSSVAQSSQIFVCVRVSIIRNFSLIFSPEN